MAAKQFQKKNPFNIDKAARKTVLAHLKAEKSLDEIKAMSKEDFAAAVGISLEGELNLNLQKGLIRMMETDASIVQWQANFEEKKTLLEATFPQAQMHIVRVDDKAVVKMEIPL